MTTSRVTPIVIEVGGGALDAELNDSATAQALIQELPLDAQASIWGEEIYFATVVDMAEEPDAVEEVPVGTLAYWPPGRAFCIFFGPTPVSRGAMPRAYSPVNLIGRVRGDVEMLRHVRNHATIRIKAQTQS